MTRQIVTVPRTLMRLFDINWDIDWRGAPGPETLNGAVVTVQNQFPRWIGAPQVYLGKTAIRQWRALRARAQGRVNLYRIPMVDPVASSINEAGTGALVKSGLPFSTGASFSTGSNWEYQPLALAVGDAAAGAEELRIDTSPTGVAPVIGQIMSYDDRPFQVTSVEPVYGSTYDIGIQMPLRAAIPDAGLIRMQGHGLFVSRDGGMGNPAHGPNLRATVTLDFVEYINR